MRTPVVVGVTHVQVLTTGVLLETLVRLKPCPETPPCQLHRATSSTFVLELQRRAFAGEVLR